MTLSDDDLLVRLRNFEDHFTERKVASDVNDILKTAVAFANSLPIDFPGVIFIPAKNDGSIQEGFDLDELQKKITRRLNSAYPPLHTTYRVVREGERQVVAVVVIGSKDRPHFAGSAFVRRGSETVNASESEFARLIAERSSKVYEISKWIGKRVRLKLLVPMNPAGLIHNKTFTGTLDNCTAFHVELTLEGGGPYAASLANIQLSFDPNLKCLMLEVDPGRS